MKRFKFSLTMEVKDQSREEAIQKVETYCKMANIFSEKSNMMNMKFVLHGLESEEDLLEWEEENSFHHKIVDLKNLN